METNPNDSAVPDFQNLVRDLEESTFDLLERKRYRFTELFSENERGEHVLNQEVFQAIRPVDADADISGAFVLFYDNRPLYIEVSSKVFSGLKQQFTGKFQATDSLAYLIATERFRADHGTEGEKDGEFAFEPYREEVQEAMRKAWEILILPEPDPYRRYLLKLYLACTLKPYWSGIAA